MIKMQAADFELYWILLPYGLAVTYELIKNFGVLTITQ